MDKVTITATVLVLGVAFLFGMAGILWMWVFFIPISFALVIVGLALGWFK